MDALANVLDPVLVLTAAGLPFALGAIVFALYRRGPNTSIMPGMPLSWAEPIEIRLVLFLLFGAIWGIAAFIPRILYPVAGEGSAFAALLLGLTIAALLLDLAFSYAAAGTLLQAAFGTRGRPAFWFSRYLSTLDSAIMSLGDILARFLLNQGPVVSKRSPERELTFETDTLDIEQEVSVQAQPQVRQARASRRDPYAVARERLDVAIAEYEHQLSPGQMEKYLLMKEIVEYLKGRDWRGPSA